MKYNNTYPNNNLCLTPSHAHRVKEEMRESVNSIQKCVIVFFALSIDNYIFKHNKQHLIYQDMTIDPPKNKEESFYKAWISSW